MSVVGMWDTSPMKTFGYSSSFSSTLPSGSVMRSTFFTSTYSGAAYLLPPSSRGAVQHARLAAVALSVRVWGACIFARYDENRRQRQMPSRIDSPSARSRVRASPAAASRQRHCSSGRGGGGGSEAAHVRFRRRASLGNSSPVSPSASVIVGLDR